MPDPEKKIARYDRIYDQLSKLLCKSSDSIAAMATINAILFHKIPYIFWVGFYLLKMTDYLPAPTRVLWHARNYQNQKVYAGSVFLRKNP